METTPRKTTAAAVSSLEALCYIAGFLLLLFVAAVTLRSEVRAAQTLDTLPDMQLWSEGRKAAYLRTLEGESATILAVLTAPSVGLSVPVYSSASTLNMDRGAGIVDGMSFPHEPGHIGIAGHRDGYFRVLKNIAVGDSLVLDTIQGELRFIVDELAIIDPDELEYLAATEESRLTIVTCYPFYFAGSAPQRYLVRAAQAPLVSPATPSDQRS